jgi:Uma2 family endonuclease
MRTVVVGIRPPELDALIARRAALGLDRFDEVWKGDYHMNPAPHSRHARLDAQLAAILHPYGRAAGLTGLGQFNLGVADDYRVPDHGFTATPPDEVFVATAAVVVEIVSPGDESYEKLGFYAERGVRSVIIVDDAERRVRIFALDDASTTLHEADACPVLGITVAELVAAIDWP